MIVEDRNIFLNNIKQNLITFLWIIQKTFNEKDLSWSREYIYQIQISMWRMDAKLDKICYDQFNLFLLLYIFVCLFVFLLQIPLFTNLQDFPSWNQAYFLVSLNLFPYNKFLSEFVSGISHLEAEKLVWWFEMSYRKNQNW